MQHNTGCGISQVSTLLGAQFNLRGHPELFGTSIIGNNKVKQDYLALATLSVGGIQIETLLKIRDNNPSLLGLDVQSALDFDLNINSCTASISATPPGLSSHFSVDPAVFYRRLRQLKVFNFFHCVAVFFFHCVAVFFQLTEADLMPIQDLPAVDPARERNAEKILAQEGTPTVGATNSAVGVFLGEEKPGRNPLPPHLEEIFGLLL